jgi:hypothetical protein
MTGETMAKLLNDFERDSKSAIPTSFTPCPLALAERDRREALRDQQNLTAAFFGDPLPGLSALDRRERESLTRAALVV